MKLSYSPTSSTGPIRVPGSKSIANRLLVLKHLYFPNLNLLNLPPSSDTQVLKLEINRITAGEDQFDAQDGGTTFRFLTSVLAFENQETHLTGTPKLLERPQTGLVDALNAIGFNLEVNNGIRFHPVSLDKLKPHWKVDVSKTSQFASALALVAPKLGKQVKIELIGEPVSLSYLDLTIQTMHDLGIDIARKGNIIICQPQPIDEEPRQIEIESDWSAVSYFVLIALLAEKPIQIADMYKDSIQADRGILEYAGLMGLDYEFIERILNLRPKANVNLIDTVRRDYTNSPDNALSEFVGCFALEVNLEQTGVDHLVFKESNRLKVIKKELEAFQSDLPVFNTHNDHRIAMCLAPLAVKKDIIINDPKVVSKSFPDFWEQLKKIGFNIQ